MVDASVSYGASGGGVFDATTGRLIGLVEGYRTARVSFKGDTAARYIDVPVPGETYVSPLGDIRRFLTDNGYADLAGLRPALAAPPRRSPAESLRATCRSHERPLGSNEVLAAGRVGRLPLPGADDEHAEHHRHHEDCQGGQIADEPAAPQELLGAHVHALRPSLIA